MLEIEQSVGVRDSTIVAVLGVFCHECSGEVEISKVLAMSGALESDFHERFQSEEDVVSEFLKDRHSIWIRWLENEIEARYEAAGGGLEIIADVLQMGFEDPKRFRRAFINISTDERTSNNEPFSIATEQKEHLRQFIEQLATRMGLRHPDEAAVAALLVIERAIVRAQMTGSLKEAQAARLLLQCLRHA